jgi:hypothetical protein
MKKYNTLLVLFSCFFSNYVSAQQSVSDWYSLTDYTSNTGGDSFIAFLTKDSSAKILIQNQLSNTFGLDHYIGSIYCPSDDIIDFTSNPLLKVPTNSFTRLDSIAFVYGYVRNTEVNRLNNNEPVVDTLIVTWFNHENLFTGRVSGGSNSIDFSLPIPSWDKYSLLHTNYFAKDTILLDPSFATTVLNTNGGYENQFTLKSLFLKAPDNLISDSTDHSKLFGYAIQFRSGVVGGDTGFMVYQKPLSTLPETAIRPNYFLYRYQIESNQGNWVEMNTATSGHIAVRGLNAYPNPQGTGFTSGNLLLLKRIMYDQVYFSSIKPANAYSIKTNNAHDICGASTKGSITITMTGGIPPYQYSINGVDYQSSNVFSNLDAGQYTVRVRDNNMIVRVAKTKIVRIKSSESGMVFGPKRVRVNESSTYSSPNFPSNFRWFVVGGVLTSSPFSATLSVLWDNQVGDGKVGLIANQGSECADTTILDVQISPPVGLSDFSQMNDIALYPNPATKTFFINGLDYKSYQVSISDLNGKLLLTDDITFKDVFEINLDEFAKGCYIVTLRQNDVVKHFKLMKH